MKNTLLFIIALALFGLGIYFALPYLKPDVSETPKEESEQVTVTNGYVREETDTYDINVAYPEFGIPAIDAQIKQDVEGAVAEFKETPSDPMPDSVVQQYTFEGTFDSVYVGPDVISAKLILSQYTGGAHPLTLVSGVNFDRATGRRLLQSDAFAMIGKSVEEVSAEATAKLKETLGESMFEEGADTNPENFSSFVISADKVTFIFQQYQVAAYAVGVQEVSFPKVQ